MPHFLSDNEWMKALGMDSLTMQVRIKP